MSKYISVHLGVTPKVVWGSLNSNSLIEWFEAVLYLGVDRIIVYVDDALNDDARRVVNYYKDKGLCEAIRYNLPDIHQPKGTFIIPANHFAVALFYIISHYVSQYTV